MKLCDLLDEQVIKVGLDGVQKEAVFAEIIDVLANAGRVADRERALRAILSRETMATTGIGNGVAVPHGKDASVPKLAAALGISFKGIQYEAADKQPVYVVFLVLADVNNPGPHVQCLGEIARLLSVPGFYERLRRCTTAQEVIGAIRAEEQAAWDFAHPMPDPNRR